MKKYLTLLCMITCTLLLTACGSEDHDTTLNETQIEIATNAIQSIVLADYSEEELSGIRSYNKFDWDAISSGWAQSGLYVSGDVVLTGIESFQSALLELGQVGDLAGNTITYNIGSHSAVVHIEVAGSLKGATVEILFDENVEITSVTTNVQYTFGEQMGTAAMNTLLGLGSVFSVLVIIMCLISLFKYIGIYEANAKKANAESTAIASSPVQAPAVVEEVEDEVNNCELVAVIAAAIAASEGATSTDGFVVRSIRKHK
ncbi:MAG: OadG family protein [Eubacteriales bacterium]